MISQGPEAADELLNVGNPVERMHDKREPGAVLVSVRRRSPAPLVLLDAFDRLAIDGGHNPRSGGPAARPHSTIISWVTVFQSSACPAAAIALAAVFLR